MHLIDVGFARHVDGWFGMWDDVGKINPEADREFRARLAANGIRPVTFNGRDMPFRLRRACIRYAVRTAVRYR